MHLLDVVPCTAWVRAETTEHVSIPGHSPNSVGIMLNPHVKLGIAIVLADPAAPGSAPITTWALDGVDGGGSSTVSICLNPVKLHAPVITSCCTIAIVQGLVEERALERSWRDGVDVCIHAMINVGQVNVILHITAEQIECRF